MIIVKTQIGTGGNWYVNGQWKTGPRNLLKAVECACEAVKSNRGVGGYRTLIEIDGAVLSHIHDGWPSTIDEARAAIQKSSHDA